MPFACEVFGPGATTSAPGSPRVIVSSEQTVLLSLLRPEVGLALWLRELPSGWTRALAPLLEATPFRVTAEGSPDEAWDASVAALPAPAPPDLLADGLRLARLFAALARTDRVRLRLEAIGGDACRKFHVDAGGLRLLVTYAGPGTQWTLGDPARAGTAIQQAPAGAVLALRGRARPGAHVVHRSPPLSTLPEARRRRLLLCLDEPEER
ncbi:MAG: DUF1826 domain-containing protein [Roseococcus sp.]|nr:DUF1826 domain-containing protein [Roseococcus sp.]